MCAPRAGGVSRDFKERSRSRASAWRVAHRPLNFAPGHAWQAEPTGQSSSIAARRSQHPARVARRRLICHLRVRLALQITCRSRTGGRLGRTLSLTHPVCRTRRQRDPPPDPQDEQRLWKLRLSESRFHSKKKGAVQARRPCPPLAKAPQRLALPPGSLVCNDRRKGGRRGVGLILWREAMALRAYGLETVERSPAPAGRSCHVALGRYRPLIEDDAPACDDSGSPDYGVATNACRTLRATSHNGQDRTAVPLRGCQWILLVPRITRTENRS